MPGNNPGNVARGLKGAKSNPNNSDEAKQSARERLEGMEESGAINSKEAHDGQVERGHKANLSNSHTSQESKQNSKHLLDDM